MTDNLCQKTTENSPQIFKSEHNNIGTLITGSDLDDQIANESPLKPCMIPQPNVFPSQTSNVTRKFKTFKDRVFTDRNIQEIKPSPLRENFKRMDSNLAKTFYIGHSPE